MTATTENRVAGFDAAFVELAAYTRNAQVRGEIAAQIADLLVEHSRETTAFRVESYVKNEEIDLSRYGVVAAVNVAAQAMENPDAR